MNFIDMNLKNGKVSLKEKKDCIVNICMSRSMKEKLEKRAEELDVSVSHIVRIALLQTSLNLFPASKN